MIIDRYGVPIKSDRQSEANNKDDLSILIIFQYSHRYAEVENKSIIQASELIWLRLRNFNNLAKVVIDIFINPSLFCPLY